MPVVATISVIIPCLNEERAIEPLLNFLRLHDTHGYIKEVIVVDGGSRDRSVDVARRGGAKVLLSQQANRGAQMNAGAQAASADIMYFLHADTFPPSTFAQDIVACVRGQCCSGCFRLRFDTANWFLRANAWFTRFNLNAVRFGDQSLFVDRDVFARAGGFDCSMQVMEDQEIIGRLKKQARFRVLQAYVTTSARKYRENGAIKLQLIFSLIVLLYYLRCSQRTLMRVYRALVRHGIN